MPSQSWVEAVARQEQPRQRSGAAAVVPVRPTDERGGGYHPSTPQAGDDASSSSDNVSEQLVSGLEVYLWTGEMGNALIHCRCNCLLYICFIGDGSRKKEATESR